jgi:hypothetical protein
MCITTKKKNREDIKEIAKNSREMFEYLLHVCNVLIDPKSHEVREREMNGLKKDLINTLQKIDSNNSKIMGRLAWEEVSEEAFSATFKLDQYYDYNAYIKNNANQG